MIERFLINNEVKYGRKIFPKINGFVYFEPKSGFLCFEENLKLSDEKNIPIFPKLNYIKNIIESIPSPDRMTLIEIGDFYKTMINTENKLIVEVESELIGDKQVYEYFTGSKLNPNFIYGNIFSKNLRKKCI